MTDTPDGIIIDTTLRDDERPVAVAFPSADRTAAATGSRPHV